MPDTDDTYDYDDWYPDEPVKPGYCGDYTPHPWHIYVALNGSLYSCSGLTGDDLAVIEAYNPPTCPHGLSPDLCAGPNHYPADY